MEEGGKVGGKDDGHFQRLVSSFARPRRRKPYGSPFREESDFVLDEKEGEGHIVRVYMYVVAAQRDLELLNVPFSFSRM